MTGDPTLKSSGDGSTAAVDQHASNSAGQGDASVTLSNYVMDQRQQQAAAKAANSDEHSSIGDVAGTFARSFLYSAVQNPIDGATQLLNGAIRPLAHGHDVIPQLQVLEAPGAVPFGGTEWVAKLAGGGIGTILPFWVGGKAAVGAVRGLEDVRFLGPAIQRAGILEENSIAQLAFKGAVYEGIFHPVDETQGSLWGQRAVNFGSGGLSFLALGAANKALRETGFGKWALNSNIRAVPLTAELLIDATSGATAGVTDTTLHAIAGGAPPTWQNLAQSAGEYGVMSIFLRLGRLPIEKAAGEKVSVVDNDKVAEKVPQDESTLRPALPFDKMPWKKTFMSSGEPGELIAKQRETGRGLFYREIPEGEPKVEGPPMRVSHDDFHRDGFQRVEHKGQNFAIGADGQAYTLQEIAPGVYELALTNQVILDRFNEVQVPWPPMQSQDQYRSRQVIKLEDLWNWRPASAH
jgi:hypothetical protein